MNEYITLYDLYKAMKEIVEEHVTHFKDDFYYHDMYNLFTLEDKKEAFMRYWLVRDTGTWLVRCDDYEFLDCARSESEYEFLISRDKYGTYHMEQRNIA